MTADVALDLDDDGSLHDLAVIHHILALKIVKPDARTTTDQVPRLDEAEHLMAPAVGWKETCVGLIIA